MIRNNNVEREYRNQKVTKMNSESILIMDTGADQCTCGGMAWIPVHDTGETVRCNGYYQGDGATKGPIVPIMSVVTCVNIPGEEPFLMLFHQTCYIKDSKQTESLCLPYQAMEHGIDFDLTPIGYTNKNDVQGTQCIHVEDKVIPLKFDGRKVFLEIRRPSELEMESLEIIEMTSPIPFEPNEPESIMTCRDKKTKYRQYPGGLTMEQWQQRLGLAPEDVIRKTFEATTQLGMNVEIENRSIGRNHYKSRFPFLREKRLNDEFHTDTFFPSESTHDGHTCSQIFLGKNTDYMHVGLMKTESHATQALQDFSREVGLPRTLKTDNATTETGVEWNNWCRKYCIKSKTTEPHSPWQNASERGIGDLGRMVKRNMKRFGAPLSRHGWCQLHCARIRNHLASRKLKWRTPYEKLTGDTPDISMFRFHFWEPVEYWDPGEKQPRSGWKKGRFLGVNWSAGDSMTFFIETEKDPGEGRNVVLTRSNVRSRQVDHSTLPSGENEDEDLYLKYNHNTSNKVNEDTTTNDEFKDSERYQMETNIIFHDDAVDDPWAGALIENSEDEADLSLVGEEISNTLNAEEEDYEFRSINAHRWTDGIILFTIELESGKTFEVPFSVIKKDRPIELAKYIKNNVTEAKRGGKYNTWAKKILIRAQRIIKRVRRSHNISRINRIYKLKQIKVNRISQNKRNEKKGLRTKFGFKVPRNVKEALLFDKENNNTEWADAIAKEMMALEAAGVWAYYPPHYKPSAEYQFTPLTMIFDIKQEDLRRKARLVAGGHVVESNMYESYSSVVQQRTIRLLETIVLNEGLSFVTGDIGNAFVQADTKEKVYTIAGREFGEKKDCTVIIKKALYGLATSARQWNITLGDSIRAMGFVPTRADPDLWIKLNGESDTYEYIATYVDDLIVVAKEPMRYLDEIKKQYPIRNIEFNPEYYLGNNIEVRKNNTMKISSKKYITEVLRKYEEKHGSLKKENVPAKPDDHPETDDTPFLNQEGITLYQSILGICQWISTSGRFDITFAVANLNRFAHSPREGHLKRAIKIFGYLKKYTKRGYVIDPREPIVNLKYEKLVPDFGNQYSDFIEDEDTRLPKAKMKELPINIFVDSNHGHDRVNGRSITGLISFVGRTPTHYMAKRQSAVQTPTFGAEFVALKSAVEEAITLRYYLRSMGVRVTKPTIIYGDNLSAITNTVNPGSALKKKYLALAYHFCREYYSAGIVDIRKIDTKDNYADTYTKALASGEFHGFMNEIMEN